MSRVPPLRLVASLLILACIPLSASAQTPVIDAATGGTKGKDRKDVKNAEGRLLNADRIARLQLEQQQTREMRDKLKKSFDKLNEEITKVSADLAGIELNIQTREKKRAALAADKKEEALILSGELKDLALQKDIAKEQFDLTLRERKLLQDRLGAYEQKILHNQITLEALLHDTGKTDSDVSDPKVKQAREEARKRDEKAKEAELATKTLEQRIQAMAGFVDLEKDLLQNDRKKLDLAQSQRKALQDDRRDKAAKGAPIEDLLALDTKIDALDKRAADIEAAIKDRAERVAKLQLDLNTLRGDKNLADQEAVQKKAEADRAGATLKRLENPFNPENILRWLVDHGPRMLLVVLGMFGLSFVVRSLDNRLVHFMTHRGSKSRPEERENRARTLASVFHNFGMVLVWAGGSLMMLEEMGIPVIPLMGGAAILGLAVAFGAQNLIKDYFYGFVILLENQYMVNDVVKIGDVSGSVERITLRMTALRDLQGVLHFIPHGQVSTVSNLTHGWSQAAFEITVPNKHDVDHVMRLLLDLGRALRRDPAYADLITEDPEMLGVNELSESSVRIKFLIKTRPLQQWKVKREMLRRIKNMFDQLNLPLPFPQQSDKAA